MADPQNPQSQAISNTPEPGYVTLPDGRVVPTLDQWFNQQANNPAGFAPSDQRTAISRGYSKVAEPLTDALGNFISTNPISDTAVRVGLMAPETNQRVSRAIAGGIIPQNLTQAGIDVGLLAGGAAGGALKLGNVMNAATTAMGATAGGVAGGYADYGDVRGALTGGGQGIAQSVPAVTATGLYNYARKMGVERQRRLVFGQDAQNMAQAVATAPRLRGVFGQPRTAADLEDLAKGVTVEVMPDKSERIWPKGSKMLSDYVERKDQEVLAMLQRVQQQRGATYQFPNALKPGEFTTWDEARKSLSELRARAYGGAKGQTLEPVAKGVDNKQLYEETKRIMQQQLMTADPSGGALRAFNDGQETFASGRAWLKDVLRPAFGKKGAEGPEFNSEVVQGKLADQRANLMRRMGRADYNSAAQAVRLQGQGVPLAPGQGPIGSQDVLNPTGLASQIAGVAPLPGAAYLRMHVGTPQMVGNPRNLTQAAQTGVSLGGTQMLAPVAQYLADQMQAQQGLPLK